MNYHTDKILEAKANRYIQEHISESGPLRGLIKPIQTCS
jgi:hypothetical protein